MKNNINQYIVEYLDYYCGLEAPPEYAILLKGLWGSGKTWLIKRYSETYKEKKHNQKVIYISLYGISSVSEIEDVLFQRLHPVLGSKPMILTGKIFKGLLKGALKVDLDKGEKLEVSGQIPDIALPDYLTNTQDCILIFDDLERCNLELKLVMGYINQFVEHKGLKVIIAANEQEIINQNENQHGQHKKDQDEKAQDYLRIKEKLIGKTFCITADVDSALTDIIAGIKKQEVRDFLLKQTDTIKEIYKIAGYENLRHLKQALWDFERLHKALPDKILNKNDLIKDLLIYALIFSFEIKSGKIQPVDIKRITGEGYHLSLMKKEKEEKNYIDEVLSKYGQINFYDTLLTSKSWIDFFDKGTIDSASIEESLLRSTYFQDETTPDWVKLWHYMDLTDANFPEILARVEKQFLNREFTDTGVISHVIGILLTMSHAGLYKKSKAQILKEGKKYVDALVKDGKLVRGGVWIGESHNGLGFHGHEFKEFKQFSSYVKIKIDEAKLASMPEAAKNLIVIMKTDTNKFYDMIHLGNSGHDYYDIPIFKYIKPLIFVGSLLDLDPGNRKIVCRALAKRYEYEDRLSPLLSELQWLKDVHKLMKAEKKKIGNTMTGYFLSIAIKSYLQVFISKLEGKIKKNEMKTA